MFPSNIIHSFVSLVPAAAEAATATERAVALGLQRIHQLHAAAGHDAPCLHDVHPVGADHVQQPLQQ